MFEVLPLAEVDLPNLQAFLHGVFSAPANHGPFRMETLRWKGFAEHPLWPSSRSFGAKHQGRIVAHGMLLPVRILLPSPETPELSANIVIDWAADSEIKGGGVAIYQQLAKLTSLQMGIGGSALARATLPRMRFKVTQQVGLYERRLRATAFHLARPLDWKTLLRMARDWFTNLSARRPALHGLTARRVTAFAETPNVPMPAPGEYACTARTPEFLDYILQCPAAQMEGFVLENNGKTAGYFLLARVANACKIADLWATGSVPEWEAALACALTEARRDPKTQSVSIVASTPEFRAVVAAQGFRLQDDQPLFVRGTPLPSGPIHLSMVDNDAFYLP